MEKHVCIILVILLGLPAFSFAKAEAGVTSQTATIAVTEKGFEPSTIKIKANTPVQLRITRKTAATCATEISIPSRKLRRSLPLNTEVVIDLGTLGKGELKFACGMDMLSGVIIAE